MLSHNPGNTHIMKRNISWKNNVFCIYYNLKMYTVWNYQDEFNVFSTVVDAIELSSPVYITFVGLFKFKFKVFIGSAWHRHKFSQHKTEPDRNLHVPGEFPHKGQWRRALMFSLICVWINGLVNNREAGDLRRYRAHCDVTVMKRENSTSTSMSSNLHELNRWLTFLMRIECELYITHCVCQNHIA